MNRTLTLINNVQNGDKASEELLIKENMPLVHSCARRLLRDGIEYDDIVQLGSIGLVKAIRKFDPALGYMFSTYAVPLIIGEIKKFLRDDGILKVSRSLKEISAKAMSARQGLATALGREPTLNEISASIGVDTEKLICSMDACRPCESLHRPIKDDGDITVADTIKSSFSYTEEIEKIALKSALNALGSRERKIIFLRYFKGKTQREISQIIGVSQVQISRIEKKVIDRLKKELK